MAVTIKDDTTTGDTPRGNLSDLAQLRKDAEAYEPKPLRYAHPTLPQYILVFRGDMDFQQLEAWRRKGITKKGRNGAPDEVDSALFNRLVLCGTSLSVEHRSNEESPEGQPILDSKGRDVSFTNPEFMAEFGVATAADLVKAFIKSDGAIAALAAQVIDDNGIGQDVESLPDPTGDAGN